MLHIHFGTGRLELRLVAPSAPGSELFLLNRAASAKKPTGCTAVNPARRNQLLRDHPKKEYLLETSGRETQGKAAACKHLVHYDAFAAYSDNQGVMQDVLSSSTAKSDGIIVTGSVLSVENYAPVVER